MSILGDQARGLPPLPISRPSLYFCLNVNEDVAPATPEAVIKKP